MKQMILGAIALAAFVLPGEKSLVVHEWGTFTTVSAADGAPIAWRPLSGPTDLPSFVYKPDHRRGDDVFDKIESMTTIRMETPVLYFYSDRETDVNVKVAFPEGSITEWYPRVVSARGGLNWGKVRVRPGAPDEFPREKAASHYYPARETDAAPIQVKSPGLVQDEKFLFYRGVGWFRLPLSLSLKNDLVSVKNPGKDPVQAILFENQKGSVGFRVLGAVQGEVTVARPELSSQAKSEIMTQLERTLIKSGLYEKEARAMIKTWRDSWFEEGLRLFYIVPRAAADANLPLTLDPQPAELVRVFVGRAEILTPEMERTALEIATRAGDDPVALSKELEPFGRFAGPLLRRALRNLPPAEIKQPVRQLLRQ